MVRCGQNCMLLAIATCCISAACQRHDSESESEPPVSELRSSLKLLIQLGDSMISELAYLVTRHGQVVRSGTFLAEGSGTSFNALIGALETADQYILTLSGTATNRQTGAPQTCSAIAAFGIDTGITTVLGVLVRCKDQLRSPGPTAGERALPNAPGDSSASVPAASSTTAGRIECARIDAVRAVPGEAPVGKSVVLKSDVGLSEDASTAPVYRWSADSGVVADQGSGRANFTCTQAGVATIVLTLSDGRPLCSDEHVFVYVTCFGVGSPVQPAGAGSQS